MKIWICGSFWTGKTTILNHLWELQKDFTHIISTERVLAKELQFDFNHASLEDRILFQKKLVTLQIELEKQSAKFITDTSLIDIIAYCNFIKNHDNDFYQNQIEKSITHYLDTHDKYDILFYLPIEFDIENDGVRHVDNTFRREIDTLISQNLELFWKKVIILEWSIKKRLQSIENIFIK